MLRAKSVLIAIPLSPCFPSVQELEQLLEGTRAADAEAAGGNFTKAAEYYFL